MAFRSTDPSVMLEYLKYAMDFEKFIYIWRNALNTSQKQGQKLDVEYTEVDEQRKQTDMRIRQIDNIYSERAMINVEKVRQLSERFESKKKKANRMLIIGIVIIAVFAVLAVAAGSFLKKNTELGGFSVLAAGYTLLPLMIFALMAPVALIIVSRIQSGNAQRAIDKIKTQNLDVEKNTEKNTLVSNLQIYKTKLSELDKAQTAIISEQTMIAENLRLATNNLAQLYRMNIIPAKYQNLVAVATMYEYLSTGRCNIVEGHGGIYDTFEEDLRFERIIGKLSDIQNSLRRIEGNQEILIEEMSQANSSLGKINSHLRNIESIDSQIAANTAISAVANTQTAASARWLEWHTRMNAR